MPVNEQIVRKLVKKSDGDEDLAALARALIDVAEDDPVHFAANCQSTIEKSVKDELSKTGGDK